MIIPMRRLIAKLFSLILLGKRWICCVLEDMCINSKFVKYEICPDPMRRYSYLRACCHVMDKGLEVDGWEPGHGKLLYEAAIQTRNKIESLYSDDNAFEWINDVIKEYELAQSSKIARSKKDIPQEIISKDELDIFNKVLRKRVSCRNFIKKEIPQVILNNLVESAIEAPVGCCRQTVRFIITQNKEIIQHIVKHVSGMTCFSNIQCVAMVYAFSAAYTIEDRRMQYIDASLAVENFVLSAAAYNLGSTICNFSSEKSKDTKAIARLLNVDKNMSPVVAIALGYPSSFPRKPNRMNVSNFVKYI